ncbi:hypothetical protein CAPTEDRAFT_227550 [Capitella teleta]|uniref:RRM domain-containing protein n=1 Tax=Capitella teleta TaxID=283909 RepID=R7V659_CAPTE|nr:hypothetical protein CAPTEDRAFT_227550 [Capitella teleta]|eukprot:ELU11225.1 hypothetical protein CAPTEDRAFT_227550 [Capitella teleta]
MNAPAGHPGELIDTFNYGNWRIDACSTLHNAAVSVIGLTQHLQLPSRRLCVSLQTGSGRLAEEADPPDPLEDRKSHDRPLEAPGRPAKEANLPDTPWGSSEVPIAKRADLPGTVKEPLEWDGGGQSVSSVVTSRRTDATRISLNNQAPTIQAIAMDYHYAIYGYGPESSEWECSYIMYGDLAQINWARSAYPGLAIMMAAVASYTPGAVAQTLKTETSKKSKKTAALFSTDFSVKSLKRKKKEQTIGEVTKKKKRKTVEPSEDNSDDSPETENPAEDEIVSESEDEVIKVSTRPKKRKRDPEADKRTVFIGNISLKAEKKDILKLFKGCGSIASIRFRSVTPSNPKLPKRAALITKDFHESMASFNAYIVFKEQESATKALKLNGEKFLNFHLRVDSLHPGVKKCHDDKRSVFLGNLPLEVQEDEVRLHFQECGEVENVRLVRDRGTGIGKGFGFVLFKDVCAVDLALKMHEEVFRGRKLRVMPSGDKQSDKKGAKGNFKLKYEKGVEKRNQEREEQKEKKKNKTGGQKVSYRERKQKNKKKSKLKQKTMQKKKMAAILSGGKKD